MTLSVRQQDTKIYLHSSSGPILIRFFIETPEYTGNPKRVLIRSVILEGRPEEVPFQNVLPLRTTPNMLL